VGPISSDDPTPSRAERRARRLARLWVWLVAGGALALAVALAVAWMVSGPTSRWPLPASVARPAAVEVAATAAVTTAPVQPAAQIATDTPTVTPDPGPEMATLPQPLAHISRPADRPTIAGPRTLAVPILMYHVIGAAPAHTRNRNLYVTPAEFAAQIRYLAGHGYQAVSLRRVYDFWQGKGRLPRHAVVISFDDGSVGHFAVAAPLLDSLGWPGVLNLIAGKTEPRIPRPMVRRLVERGWEIDSHTVSHEELRGLSSARLKYELDGSRDRLRKWFGVPAEFLCYPSGRFDRRVAAAAKEAGYLGATTTEPGFARPGDMFALRRVRVSGGESLRAFGEMLEPGR
jgi:peptidoglycan/xylan/chitin deacetylase (PgdA/CDA1 family)